jgi:hypothetical protein
MESSMRGGLESENSSTMTQPTTSIAESDSVSTADASRSWRRELVIGMLIFTMLTGIYLLIGWYNGRGLRPFAVAGFLSWMATTFALSVRRRWIKLRHPELASRSLRFSFLELLVLVTGLTLFIGFTIADYHESARVLRERSALRSNAETLLGLDGHLGFDADGSLTIAVCDRSFDDARLVKLVQMIDDWHQNVGVSRFNFGTSMKTGGTPPVWPGVTDRSVDLLLEWDELEWLSVDGTAISADGRERLLTLPQLNDFSRNGLKMGE